MKAFLSKYMTGQQAIDHIVVVTGCTVDEAWVAFRDAAAEGNGELKVRIQDVNSNPQDMPLRLWKQAAQSDDLWLLTDLVRYEVPRRDVERLWVAETPGKSVAFDQK